MVHEPSDDHASQTDAGRDRFPVEVAILDHRHGIFFAAVQNSRMAMVVTDPKQHDNPIVFCNSAFMKLTGYDKHEIIGRNCRFLQGPDTDPKKVAEIRTAIEERRESSVEMLNYRKDGSAFWNALYVNPVFDDKTKEVVYFFASQLDITRRLEAEEALRQAQKMEAVGQLTGGIAHDFNNLLQIIIGSLDRLSGEQLTPRAEKLINDVLAAAERGGKMTGQLLAFARRQRLVERTLNLNTITEQVHDILVRAMAANIEIRLRLAPDLALSTIDGTQAEQAILNCALNSRDAMPNGGVLTLTTTNDFVSGFGDDEHSEIPPGDYVVISISDTGEGMDTATLAHATEPFFTTKPVGRGSGMGLAMVHGFVKQSKGFLRISSVVGQGTTVRMYFPADVETITQVAAHIDVTAPPAPSAKLGTTVLVVDDDAGVRDLALSVLSDFGYRTLWATNGQEALAIIEGGERIDLLFADLMMPVMGGVTLARLALETRPKLRVLLTTGYSEPPDAPSLVGYEVLPKPYRRSELLKMVRRVLDGPASSSV